MGLGPDKDIVEGVPCDGQRNRKRDNPRSTVRQAIIGGTPGQLGEGPEPRSHAEEAA